MKNPLESKSNQYQSYLLRMWKNGDGDWRALLVSIPTQERRHFSSLPELFEFLSSQRVQNIDLDVTAQGGISSHVSLPSLP
jgi:hypothetical protein